MAMEIIGAPSGIIEPKSKQTTKLPFAQKPPEAYSGATHSSPETTPMEKTAGSRRRELRVGPRKPGVGIILDVVG